MGSRGDNPATGTGRGKAARTSNGSMPVSEHEGDNESMITDDDRVPLQPTRQKQSNKRHTVASLSSVVNTMQDTAQENFDKNDARVGRLEGQVSEVNQKLDRMMDMISKFPSNGALPEGPRSNLAPTRSDAASAGEAGQPVQVPQFSEEHTPVQVTYSGPSRLPPPHVLITEQNKDGALDKLMSKEDYRPSNAHGKTGQNDHPMVKPYMFIDREGMQTAKQRLEVRANMSFNEYINCSLLLLNDEETYNPSDLKHILRHLSAVTTDAMVRPWAGVRRWSQYIWDCVERGKCKWDGYNFIQDERVRMSYMSGPQPSVPAHTSNTRAQGQDSLVVVLCRDFNGPTGCRFQGTHEDKNVKHLHACSHCDTLGRRSNHSYQRCRSKINYHQYPNTSNPAPTHQDQRQRPQAPLGYNHHHQYGTHQQTPGDSRGSQHHVHPTPKNA